MDVKFKLKSIEEGKAAPVLASFVQGPPVEESLTGASTAGSPFPPLAFCFSVPRSDAKRGQAVLTADNGITRYEGGAAAHSQSAVTDASKYFVGVYSRKRKRVEVFPTEADCGVFNLNMTAVQSPNGALGGSGAGDLEGLSARGRRDLLIDAFGSRKKQKMEKSKKANIVDVKAVAAAEDVAATLQETSAALGAMKDDGEEVEVEATSGMGGASAKVDAALMAARKATLPPFNEAASRPSDAYPLHSLIDDEVADALAGKVHATFHAALEAASVEDVMTRFRSPYGLVCDALRRIVTPIAGMVAEGEDGNWSEAQTKVLKAAKRRLRVLQYLQALLDLALAPEKLVYTMPLPPKVAEGGEGGEAAAEAAAAPAPEEPAAPLEPTIRSLRFVPKALVAPLLARFTEARPDRTGTSLDGKTYARTPALKDKLIAHLACAMLHLDDFSSDTRGLQTALKLTPLRVCHYFRELGCVCVPVRAASMDAPPEEAKPASGKVGATKGTVIVSYACELKTPLAFPRPKLGRAK